MRLSPREVRLSIPGLYELGRMSGSIILLRTHHDTNANDYHKICCTPMRCQQRREQLAVRNLCPNHHRNNHRFEMMVWAEITFRIHRFDDESEMNGLSQQIDKV